MHHDTKDNIKNWSKKISKDASRALSQIPYPSYVYAAFIVNALVILLVFVFKTHLPPQVPLFYGLAKGERQLAEKTSLLLPNLSSLLILTINLALANFSKDEFIRKTLIVSGLACSILATITVAKIIFLVGNF